MWSRFKNYCLRLSNDPLNEMRLWDKDYSRPTLKDYFYATWLTVLVSSPFHAAIGFMFWIEFQGEAYSLSEYLMWTLLFNLLFVLLFIVPDRWHRIARDNLLIKFKYWDMPLWSEGTRDVEYRKGRQRQLVLLMSNISVSLSYISFFILSLLIMEYMEFDLYRFQIGNMALLFVFITQMAFIFSFYIIKQYTKPRRIFLPMRKRENLT